MSNTKHTSDPWWGKGPEPLRYDFSGMDTWNWVVIEQEGMFDDETLVDDGRVMSLKEAEWLAAFYRELGAHRSRVAPAKSTT